VEHAALRLPRWTAGRDGGFQGTLRVRILEGLPDRAGQQGGDGAVRPDHPAGRPPFRPDPGRLRPEGGEAERGGDQGRATAQAPEEGDSDARGPRLRVEEEREG